MRTRFWLTSIFIAASVILAACGGGESSEDDSPEGPPDTVALAAAAQLSADFAPETKIVVLTWKDVFPQGSRYAVQGKSGSESFTTLETLTGTGASSSQLSWQRTLEQSTTFQVLALFADGSSTPLQTAQGQTSVTATVPVTDPQIDPQISISSSEPLSETVNLSLLGGGRYLTVRWYIDTRVIGLGIGDGVFTKEWDTTKDANGPHVVVARVQTSLDVFTDIRRTVDVYNVNLTLTAVPSRNNGIIDVNARASSLPGIARVESSFDGGPTQTLTAPNACSRYCEGINDLYRFTVDGTAAGSGDHTMRITAVDRENNSKTINVPVPVDNRPILNINTPLDGDFVYGNLQLNGSVSSDKNGSVTTTASLGQLPFLNTTSPTINGSLDLSGLPAQQYTLSVTSKDSGGTTTLVQRNVIVASDSSRAYMPITQIGAGGTLVASDDRIVLYKTANGDYHLFNTETDADSALANAKTIVGATGWQMIDGWIFVQGKDSDCEHVCIYQWDLNGSRTNLSALRPYYGTTFRGDSSPIARGQYVVWKTAISTNASFYTVYNRGNNSFLKIDAPANATSLGSSNYDAAVDNGNLRFFFWTAGPDADLSTGGGVYRWDESSQVSTKLSGGKPNSTYTQTDGSNVIWLQYLNGSYYPFPGTLNSQPIGGGTVTVLSNAATGLQSADGVATWVENVSSGKKIMARYSGVTYTLTSSGNPTIYGTTGGIVIYSVENKTYRWTAATNTTTLIVDANVSSPKLKDSQFYFTMGTVGLAYRVGL